MNIADVIGWKFNHQSGMRCKEIDGAIEITEFPGGIPSQAEQDLWTSEYQAWVAAGGLLDRETDAKWKDDPQNDALMLVLFETYNEARAGNGKQPITKQQFWGGVKAKVRTEKFFDF